MKFSSNGFNPTITVADYVSPLFFLILLLLGREKTDWSVTIAFVRHVILLPKLSTLWRVMVHEKSWRVIWSSTYPQKENKEQSWTWNISLEIPYLTVWKAKFRLIMIRIRALWTALLHPITEARSKNLPKRSTSQICWPFGQHFSDKSKKQWIRGKVLTEYQKVSYDW